MLSRNEQGVSATGQKLVKTGALHQLDLHRHALNNRGHFLMRAFEEELCGVVQHLSLIHI